MLCIEAPVLYRCLVLGINKKLCWRNPTYPKSKADPRYFYLFQGKIFNDKNILKT